MTNYKNFAQSTLSVAIDADDLTLTVADSAKFPAAPFYITINSEIMLVTNVSNLGVFTVTRAQQTTSGGGAATNHASASIVASYLTAGDLVGLAQTEDLGTAAYLDAGNTAGKVVVLDNAGKLPAVDGSQLTNISGGGGGFSGEYDDLTGKPDLDIYALSTDIPFLVSTQPESNARNAITLYSNVSALRIIPYIGQTENLVEFRNPENEGAPAFFDAKGNYSAQKVALRTSDVAVTPLRIQAADSQTADIFQCLTGGGQPLFIVAGSGSVVVNNGSGDPKVYLSNTAQSSFVYGLQIGPGNEARLGISGGKLWVTDSNQSAAIGIVCNTVDAGGTITASIFTGNFAIGTGNTGKILTVDASGYISPTAVTSTVLGYLDIGSSLTGLLSALAGTIPSAVSQLSNDSNFITIGSVPTKTSDLTNDSSFVASGTGVSVFANDQGYQSAAEVSAIASGLPISTFANDSGFIGTAGLASYALTSSIPTAVSQLTNDSGYVAAGAGVSSFTNDQSYASLTDVSSAITTAFGSPVANGTYTVGLGLTTDGTITVVNGIITAIQQAS